MKKSLLSISVLTALFLCGCASNQDQLQTKQMTESDIKLKVFEQYIGQNLDKPFIEVLQVVLEGQDLQGLDFSKKMKLYSSQNEIIKYKLVVIEQEDNFYICFYKNFSLNDKTTSDPKILSKKAYLSKYKYSFDANENVKVYDTIFPKVDTEVPANTYISTLSKRSDNSLMLDIFYFDLINGVSLTKEGGILLDSTKNVLFFQN